MLKRTSTMPVGKKKGPDILFFFRQLEGLGGFQHLLEIPADAVKQGWWPCACSAVVIRFVHMRIRLQNLRQHRRRLRCRWVFKPCMCCFAFVLPLGLQPRAMSDEDSQSWGASIYHQTTVVLVAGLPPDGKQAASHQRGPKTLAQLTER